MEPEVDNDVESEDVTTSSSEGTPAIEDLLGTSPKIDTNEEVENVSEEGEGVPEEESITPSQEPEVPSVDIAEELRVSRAKIADLEYRLSEVSNSTTTPQTSSDIDFLGETSPEDIVMEKPALNALLNRVYKQAQEAVLSQVPVLASRTFYEQTAMQQARDTFYRENADLNKDVYRPTVARIADGVAKMHPEWSLNEVLQETARTTREVLGMQRVEAAKKVPTVPSMNPSKTTLPPPKIGTRKAVPVSKMSAEEKDVLDLIS